jgi:hypothetical protein
VLLIDHYFVWDKYEFPKILLVYSTLIDVIAAWRSSASLQSTTEL